MVKRLKNLFCTVTGLVTIMCLFVLVKVLSITFNIPFSTVLVIGVVYHIASHLQDLVMNEAERKAD